MLVHPELRQECPCYGAALGKVCGQCYLIWPDNACYDDCILCHGAGYVAPPPETWCGLLVALMIANDERLHLVVYPLYSVTERMDVFVGVQVKLEGGIVGEGQHLESALMAALEQAAAR